MDFSVLDACLQTEYSNVTTSLIDTRQTLAERTTLFEQTSKDLAERTDELVDNRKELATRTKLYEQASKDLVHRTDDLIFNRQTIVERTEMLEQLANGLKECTEELEQIKIAYTEIKKTPLRFAIKSTFPTIFKK